MRVRVVAVVVALAVVLALVAAACGGDDASGGGRTRLTVLAAASLTDALPDAAAAFERAHPDVDVTTSFAASSALAAQIDAGGPGDVFVSADEKNMQAVVDAGHAGGAPVVVARNRLAILVEKGNPKGVHGLADLARDDLVVVLCAPEVPCGRYAQLAITKAGVDVRARSLEENVKAVVAKVTLGEADAGIVYATDVEAAGPSATGVPIAGADDPALLAVYPAAVVRSTRHGREATAFVSFLRSAAGQRILGRAGFLPAG